MCDGTQSLVSVLALWVVLLRKSISACFTPFLTLPHQPLRHLLRHPEGALPNHAARVCVVITGVSYFNMEEVNLE